MKKGMYLFMLITAFFVSCNNDNLSELSNPIQKNSANKILVSNDNKIALNAFLNGIGFDNLNGTRSVSTPTFKLRYYSDLSGSCWPLQVDCLPELIVVPKPVETDLVEIWENTNEGKTFAEKAKNGEFSKRTITNENGTFVFYTDKNQRRIVIQLK